MLDEEKQAACVGYALRVLLGEEGVRLLREGSLAYGSPHEAAGTGAKLFIVSSDFFRKSYGRPASLPNVPLKEVEGVPLLFGSPAVRRQNGRLIVHADVVASTYFLATRYEEMVRRDVRDEHGRFPGRESLAARGGFIDRPVVDEYGVLVRGWLRESGVEVAKPQRRFSALLTHDVDAIQYYRNPVRTIAGVLIGRRRWREIAESVAVWLGRRKDPFDTFDEMMRLDATVADVPAETAYFFAGGGCGGRGVTYDSRWRTARALIRRLKENGAVIGLHTSHEAGIHRELIAEEKARLETICGFAIEHNRHHYLAWREMEDGRALADAGIRWDSTLGYADVAGFRLGVCRPVELFDPVTIRPMGIEEHPLIVMDCTLSDPRYMGLGEAEALDYCKKLIEQVRKHNGEFVTLWHNTMFAEEPGNYHPRLYRRLLRELGGGP